MPRTQAPLDLTAAAGRRIWLHAQGLDRPAPFGTGAQAVADATAHLGYVQIDTIHVIERSHHHILATRIPGYQRSDLARAQSLDKSVFEYWTHALAYVPTADLPHYLRDMAAHRANPSRWFGSVTPADLRAMAARIRAEGPMSIRDLGEERVEKTHPWASRKPGKRALELGFYAGLLTVSARTGMVKTYELMDRHFGWPPRPRPASEARTLAWRLDRALRAQGLVSLDSICFGAAALKPAMAGLIAARVKARRLIPATLDGAPGFWIAPKAAEPPAPAEPMVHLLSPFDPLAIQRRRLARFFGYAHRFEAYLPAEKRVHGYFALPVLVGDRVCAAIDIRCDRAAGRLDIRQWTPTPDARPEDKARIEAALDGFERFQLNAAPPSPDFPSPDPSPAPPAR